MAWRERDDRKLTGQHNMQRSAATISASLKKVPPFPPVAAKLLTLLSSPAVDTNEVADLIGSDASFTARLLQRVNSAEFGFVSDITSVRRAVALLGLDTTRQITLAHATAAYAEGGLRTESMRRSWQHMVATAVLAEEIAVACDAFASVAFTAGIMHDIGRLGLLVAYPEEYEQVIRNAAERSLDVLDFEQEEFGAHHAEAGRLLAELWGLPPEMGLIAGRHHDPCEGTELDLLRIVHVACRLADVLGYDVVRPLSTSNASDIIAELPARARQELMRDPAELCGRIEQKIREFGSEPAQAPPEETLALLASGAANDPPPATSVAEADVESGGAAEAPVTTGSLESAGQQTGGGRKRAIGLWIVAGLAFAIAAVWWVLR
jgi:HD-like signal output (HDOD) protein